MSDVKQYIFTWSEARGGYNCMDASAAGLPLVLASEYDKLNLLLTGERLLRSAALDAKNIIADELDAARSRIAELEAGIPKFDPVVLSMLYTAADEVKPTHRGAVLRAYEYIRALLPKESGPEREECEK